MPHTLFAALEIVVLAGIALHGASAQDLSVTVLDFATGQPLGSADVSLLCGDVLVGLETTDSLGRAVFTHPVDTEEELVPDRGFLLAPPYPNPATRWATALLRVDQEAPLALGLFDVLGRKVLALTTWVRPGTHMVEMELGDLPAGTYFLRADREGSYESTVSLVKWGAEAGARAVRLTGTSPENLPDPVSKTGFVGQSCQVHVSREGYQEAVAEITVPGDLEVTVRLTPQGASDFVNSFGMKFTMMQPGSFLMGSQAAYEVTLTEPYLLGTYEVTLEQWCAVLDDSACNLSRCDECPVRDVSWLSAQTFIARLNGREETCRYRLPSEAEWEYAARAGTTTVYWFGDDDPEVELAGYAWYRDNASENVHPVGSKAPNPWGLYDMYGNVAEWVQDWYAPLPEGKVSDPTGPGTPYYSPNDPLRVLRGGSLGDGAPWVNSVRRSMDLPWFFTPAYGLRIVRTVGSCPVPRVGVYPDSIEFGEVEVGKLAERTIAVVNMGWDTLQVTVTGGPDFEENGFALVAGQGSRALTRGDTLDVVIRLAPLSATVKSSVLVITHNATNEPNPALVELRGVGVGGSNDDVTNSIGMLFRRIPAGTFPMGSLTGSGNEQPVHEVTLSRDFYLGACEVTRLEWRAVMGSVPGGQTPCPGEIDENCPVERVSWPDAIAFANALSAAEGIPPCYDAYGEAIGGDPYLCEGYRLPTEAEWEYAARAGTTSEYSFGEDFPPEHLGDYGWYLGNSGSRVHPTRSRLPNAWGLFDVHGNVSEWVYDLYSSYGESPVTDPDGPEDGYLGIYRGGGGADGAYEVRSAWRGTGRNFTMRFDFIGFRLARTAP